MGSNERKTRKKLNKVHVSIIVTVLVLTVPRVITAFPRVWHDGMGIRVFSIDRMVRENLFARMDSFEGRVLGNHVLETEHGEIVLRNNAHVGADNFALTFIDAQNFRRGRATHNLVVEGIEMPPNIDVGFRNRRISILVIDQQEVIIADIPFGVGQFSLDSNRHAADIVMGLTSFPEYLVLEDNTEIHFDPRGVISLFMYKDDEQWRLRVFHNLSFMVVFSGETEPIRYRSITFKPNWGEFIEGELFE